MTPGVIWIATEFDVDDGGRAWIQASTDPDVAKNLCQDHYRQHGGTGTLDWSDDAAAAWMFGQATQAARPNANSLAHYEIRRVEVTA